MDKKKKIKLLNCCFIVWVVIGLTFAIFDLFFLDDLIVGLAKDNIKMAEDTYNIWG